MLHYVTGAIGDLIPVASHPNASMSSTERKALLNLIPRDACLYHNSTSLTKIFMVNCPRCPNSPKHSFIMKTGLVYRFAFGLVRAEES